YRAYRRTSGRSENQRIEGWVQFAALTVNKWIFRIGIYCRKQGVGGRFRQLRLQLVDGLPYLRRILCRGAGVEYDVFQATRLFSILEYPFIFVVIFTIVLLGNFHCAVRYRIIVEQHVFEISELIPLVMFFRCLK